MSGAASDEGEALVVTMRMTRLERAVVWGLTGGLCSYCGRQTGRKQSTDLQFTVDHAIPLSRNGRHALSNWRPCCLACNELKSDLTEQEFLALPAGRREEMRAKLAQVLCRLGPLGWREHVNRQGRCTLIKLTWDSVESHATA